MNDQQEAIAAGWNVSLGSLIPIASITPSSDEAFAPPKSTGLYNPGKAIPSGDGNMFLQGYASIGWMFTRLTWLQYYYASTTWCSGGLSGPVTILVPLNSQNGTYTRRNAILVLPAPKDLRSEYRYQEATFMFTRLKVPS